MDRREFLRRTSAVTAAACLPSPTRTLFADAVDTFLAQTPCPPDPLAGGTRLGLLPLSAPGGIDHPLETIIGRGLDARLVTDLSSLTTETLVTPNDRFFIRTLFPEGAPAPDPWVVAIGGRVRSPRTIAMGDLTARASPLGPYVMECAGNSNPANFGLMSAARWGGVPLLALLQAAHPEERGTRVSVTGFDEHAGGSRRSRAGASWVFGWDDLAATGAFLATTMNGVPLPRHHGGPVRLVVPGWYGAACIKWVTSIDVVADEVASTPQMREYASRTHQSGVPELARDFVPAEVDVAAMPIRVERWRVDGALRYRVAGVVWGGKQPARDLRIRVNRDQPYQPVTLCPPPSSVDTWSLWTYTWTPAAPGRYQFVLTVGDPGVRTRRLDIYFYVREVWIDEV